MVTASAGGQEFQGLIPPNYKLFSGDPVILIFFREGCQIFAASFFHQKKRRKSYFPDLATPDGRLSGRWFRPEPAGSSGCSGFEARPRLLLNDV